MFVDVEPKVILAKNNNLKIEIIWYFDQLSTEGFLIDYDKNGNSKLDKSECKTASMEIHNNIIKRNYYTEFKINGKKQKLVVENVRFNMVEIKDNKKKKLNILAYKFILKGSYQKLDAKKRLHADLSFYDDSIYSVLYPKKDMAFKKGIDVIENKTNKPRCLFTFTLGISK